MEKIFKKEATNVLTTLKDTTILYDILLVIGTIAICLCLILFGLGAAGKTKFIDYTYTIGYLIILIIIISTARQMYTEIHYSFKEKCDAEDTALQKDFIIESNNRFYSIFSFMYYYIKTFIIVLFNVAFVFLGLFIFFIMLRSNVLYKQTWIKDKINEFWDSEQPTFSLLLVYLVLALLLGLYLFFMSYVFISEKILGRQNVPQINITLVSKIGVVVFAFFVVFLLPGLLYYLDLYTDLIRIVIQRAQYIVYDNINQKVILRYPLLELFKQHNIFAAINLTNIKILKRFIRIFVFGLMMSCFYAFFILPQFDVERYCHLQFIRKTNIADFHSWTEEAKNELDQLHIIAQQYQARFKMGYFVVIVLIIFYHMVEISKDAIFRYFWIALKSKPNDEDVALYSSIDNDISLLNYEYKTLLKSYRDYKDQKTNNENNENNKKINDDKQGAIDNFKEKYRDFIQSLQTIYMSYVDKFKQNDNLSQGLKIKMMTALDKIKNNFFYTPEIYDDHKPRIPNVDEALSNSRQAKKLKKIDDQYQELMMNLDNDDGFTQQESIIKITERLCQERKKIMDDNIFEEKQIFPIQQEEFNKNEENDIQENVEKNVEEKSQKTLEDKDEKTVNKKNENQKTDKLEIDKQNNKQDDKQNKQNNK